MPISNLEKGWGNTMVNLDKQAEKVYSELEHAIHDYMFGNGSVKKVIQLKAELRKLQEKIIADM